MTRVRELHAGKGHRRQGGRVDRYYNHFMHAHTTRLRKNSIWTRSCEQGAHSASNISISTAVSTAVNYSCRRTDMRLSKAGDQNSSHPGNGVPRAQGPVGGVRGPAVAKPHPPPQTRSSKHR